MRIRRPWFHAAVVASLLIFALSALAWVEAVRLPDYANYWEWRDGWHVGVCNHGTLYGPRWWDTYVYLGHFPDHGVPVTRIPQKTSDTDRDFVFLGPYRWPDPNAREVRLAWPMALSTIAPALWVGARIRRQSSRGFPIA